MSRGYRRLDDYEPDLSKAELRKMPERRCPVCKSGALVRTAGGFSCATCSASFDLRLQRSSPAPPRRTRRPVKKAGPLMAHGTCATCGAPMIWATSPKGAALPLDARPVSSDDLRARTYVTVYSIDGPPAAKVDAVPYSRLLQAALADGDLLVYVSHFATCPNASQHSRR